MNLLKKLSLGALLLTSLSLGTVSANTCVPLTFKDKLSFDATLLLAVSQGQKARPYVDCIRVKLPAAELDAKINMLPKRLTRWLDSIYSQTGMIDQRSLGSEREDMKDDSAEAGDETSELPEVKPSKVILKFVAEKLMATQIERFAGNMSAEIFYYSNTKRVSHVEFLLR